LSDDINELSDTSILEFAENLNGDEYVKDSSKDEDAEKKPKENKSKKNSTK